jgi:hypothetical protein
MRILNLACGRCDEAETLIKVGSDLTKGGAVEMIGADIRIREIRQARETHGHLPAQFLIEDATKIDQHKDDRGRLQHGLPPPSELLARTGAVEEDFRPGHRQTAA